MPVRIASPGRKVDMLADRRGAAAAEFALMLPVLSLLMIGVWQYGTLYYSYNLMTNAARNGARAMAINSATIAETQATMKANMPSWIPAGDVTALAQNTTTGGAATVTTRITVPASKATVFALGPMPATIEALVVMEREI